MTTNELAELMIKQFARIDERFERIDERFQRIEEILGDHTGKLITIDDRLARVEFILDEANPVHLKKRIEVIEAKFA